MTECSDAFIQSIPLEEQKRRLAAVYTLILSLPDPKEKKDRLGVDIVDGIRFEDERDRHLQARNIIHINKIAGQTADDSDRQEERGAEPLSLNISPDDIDGGG